VGTPIKVTLLIATLTDASDEIQFQKLQQLMVSSYPISMFNSKFTIVKPAGVVGVVVRGCVAEGENSRRKFGWLERRSECNEIRRGKKKKIPLDSVISDRSKRSKNMKMN
jgi:hypothetical protein